MRIRSIQILRECSQKINESSGLDWIKLFWIESERIEFRLKLSSRTKYRGIININIKTLYRMFFTM